MNPSGIVKVVPTGMSTVQPLGIVFGNGATGVGLHSLGSFQFPPPVAVYTQVEVEAKNEEEEELDGNREVDDNGRWLLEDATGELSEFTSMMETERRMKISISGVPRLGRKQ